MKSSILSRIVRVAENLYREPASGRYYGIKKVQGRQKLKSLGTTDKPTAKRELRRWIAKVESGATDGPDVSLETLLKNFLASQGGRAPRTRTNKESIATALRRTFTRGMRTRVREIRTSDLSKWLTSEADAREWGASYYNAVRLFLRQMFDLAIADRIIDENENPFRARLIKARKREKTVRRIPTLEQFEKIIKSVRAQRDNRLRNESANFLAFLGLAGVGQAEASNLKWHDVSENRITFKRQKTGKNFVVPMYQWLAPLVAKRRAMRNDAGDDAYVFKVDDAKKALRGACKRLGFHQFTQRNLRAMCIKRLYDRGVPVKQIALWQGHSDGGRLIQEVYTEVFSDSDAAAEAANLALVTETPGNVVKFAA